MKTEQVKDHFRRQVHEYEDLMRRLIPDYDFQAQLLLDLIPFDRMVPIRVLDLGSGPATLSELVLEAYPRSKVVAIDITDEMIDVARSRCARFENRFEAKVGDFGVDAIQSKYDLIVAGLSLHHLGDEDRQAMFNTIFASLGDSGAFLAREVVRDPDPYIADWHYEMWKQFMRRNGEDGEVWFQRHLAKDHPAAVEDQLAWLRSARFAHVACHWQYLNFAILSAHK